MTRGNLIAPSKPPGMWWGTGRRPTSRCLHPLGGSKHHQLQHGAGMFEVDVHCSDSLNTHCEQFGNSREMVNGSGHLKLWNSFSSAFLIYAESQNLNNLWREIPTLLTALIALWPLSCIWHVDPSFLFETFSFWRLGHHSFSILPLAHWLLLFLGSLLVPPHLPDL